MTVSVSLPPLTEAKLVAEAKERGVGVEEIIHALINEHYTDNQPAPTPSSIQTATVLSYDELDPNTWAAWDFYDRELRATLELAHRGQVVAIHPASGDYEVAVNSPRARKALRLRHADGYIATIDIGVFGVENSLMRRM